MKPYDAGLLLAIALSLASPKASAQQEEKAAQKVVKKTLSAAVKTNGKDVNALVKPAKATLHDTKAAMSSGESAPGDGVSVMADVLASLNLSLADTTTANMVEDACAAIDAALSAAGLPLPKTALVGTGSVFDKRLAKIWKQYSNGIKKGRKSAQSVVKTLAKLGEPGALRTPDTQQPAWAPGFFDAGPPPDVVASLITPPTLQLTALVGHSDGDDTNDGSLEIAGFTLLTDDVLVSGKGPDGAYFEPIAVTPAPDGTFEATATGLVEGNWRLQAIQPYAIATDFVAIPGAPDPGTDPVTPAQAAKEARKGWKQLDKQHAKAVNQAFKTYKAAIKTARKSLKGGADPAGLIEDVYAALTTLQLSLDAATNGAAGIGPTADATFGAQLDELDQLVTEHLVGFGQSNDKVSARVDKRLQQRSNQAIKVARSFAGTLAKKSDMRMSVNEWAVPFFRAAPVKGPELPVASVPLRFEILVGSSEQGVDADGVIRLIVSGDDTLGPRANLGLFGPDGFFLFHDIAAADLVGGLELRFPAEGPGDLPEGNYVAVLLHASEVVSASISVPGGD